MKFLFYTGIVISLLSCKETYHGFKTPVSRMETGRKYSFENRYYQLDTIAKKTENFNLDGKNTTLLGLFSIQPAFSQVVSIEIGNDDSLRLSYYDDSLKMKSYKVKRRKCYYQYFCERNIVEVPPIVSFFYGKRKIDRLRIALNKSGELMVNNKYIDHNNVLFLGGGGEYNQNFTYRVR